MTPKGGSLHHVCCMTGFKGVVERFFAFVSLLVAVSEKMLNEQILYQCMSKVSGVGKRSKLTSKCHGKSKTGDVMSLSRYIRRNGRHHLNSIKRPVLQVKRNYSGEPFYDADLAT